MDGRWREKYDRYSAALQQWSAAFNSLLALRKDVPPTDVERRSIALLRVYEQYCATALIPFSVPQPHGPLLFDNYTDSFIRIVGLAAEALELNPKDESSWEQPRTREPQFHLEIGVTVVLFSTIIMCRDPSVRRKAMRIMRHTPEQEGIWNRALALRVAARIVALEELGLDDVQSASDIPEEARIQIMGITLHAEKKQATFQCKTLVSHWQELISW